VYYSVIQTFYALFYHLESCGQLDVESDVDLFCLHYVYVPRINHSLNEFAVAYNNHGLRTQQCWTPLQMWTNGMIHRDCTAECAIDNYQIFGIDPEAPLSDDNDQSSVEVPQTQVPLTDQQMEALLMHIHPLAQSDEHGVDIYLSVRDYVQSSIS
jgi:hypothetical protein